MTGDNDDTENTPAFEQLTMFAAVVQKPATLSTKKTEKAEKKSDKKPDNKADKKIAAETIQQIESKPKENSPMQAAEQTIDFEASLTKLEAVVKELDGEVKLEEALKLFEEGIKLSVECEKFIKSAEQKIEILKKTADGSIEPESFAHETEKILSGD